MEIIGGIEPGELDFVCECGRSLGKANKDGTTRIVSCECGREMSIAELKVMLPKPRMTFVARSE